MAEAFLEEIYGDAKIVYEARRIVEYAKVYDKHHATMIYNEILPRLLDICQRYTVYDRAGGEELSNCIADIKKNSNDFILMGDIIENKVILLLEKSMRQYGTIQTENEEGDFLFETAVSGFLTLKDLRQNVYVHSTVCPMWEAKKIAEYIFDPRKKAYSILGCGLGYLAYQLYVMSEGAAVIRIFERDARVVEYAGNYGVLDWIPADRVETVVTTDLLAFLHSTLEADTGFYIMAMEIAREPADSRPILQELYAQWSTVYKFKRKEEINYWSNIRSGCKLITEFDSSRLGKDFIIVAAGPSLDDNLEFLKENQGKKTIIAVGTVFKKLLKNNITPDMVAILDAQERTYKQIEGVEEQKIPMLLGITAYWKFAVAYQGEKYLIPLNGMENLDNITEKYKDVWQGGGTVTSLAIEAAIRFKAERIFLVGVDLAYPEGMSHATETMDRSRKSLEELQPVEGQNGTTVYTTVVFNSYRHEIEAMIAAASGILYYNMSTVGAKIAGTQNYAEELKVKQPLVSVVIPTYNRIHTLPASVESVLKQTYENLELIIMDDGSDDGTEAYVSSIADKRVRYRKADKNMGPSAARNKGAELARGEYLAFQDSDDEWMPDKLEKQMKLMLEGGELALVYSEFGLYRDGELLAVIPSRNIPCEEKQGDLSSYLLLYPLISTQTILIRTGDFIEEGGFNEALKAYEDFEFTMRFAQKHRIGFVQEALVKVNNQPNSVSKQFEERIRVQFYMIREMLKPLRERNFLWRKLKIVLDEAETLECYERFAQELQSLSEELLSEEEQREAVSFLEKIEQSAESHQLQAQLCGNIRKLKQKTLYIYEELYENRLVWSGEVQKVLKEMVGSVELFGNVLPVPDKVRERCAVIQKSLSEENPAEADRLYLLADIVELFETLEQLW